MKVLQVSDEFRSVCSACEIQEGGSPFHLSSCPHLLLQKGGVPRWSENPKSSPMPSLSQATEVACLRSPANQSQYWDQNPASKLLFSILCVSSPRVCVSVCVCMCVCVCVSLVAQSCPTLCNPLDCSLPGSSVHFIFQEFSKNTRVGCHALLQRIFPTQVSYVSCIIGRFFTPEPYGVIEVLKSRDFLEPAPSSGMSDSAEHQGWGYAIRD